MLPLPRAWIFLASASNSSHVLGGLVMPVLALYLSANCFQNAAVWSLEYSAATSLIEVTFAAPLLDPPPAVPLPLPPLQAESTNAAAPAPAINAVIFRAIESSRTKKPFMIERD